MSRIYTKKNANGEVVYYGDYLINGTRIRRKLGHSRVVAQRRFKEVEHELLFGVSPTPDPIRLAKAFETFQVHVKNDQVKPHRKNYIIRTVERFVNYAGKEGIKLVRDLTPELAMQYVQFRSNQSVKNKYKYKTKSKEKPPTLSAKTVNNEIQILRRFGQFCADRDWLPKNVFRQVQYRKRSSNGERFYFTEKHLKNIFQVAGKFTGFYALMLYTGLRPTDAYDVTREHLTDGELLLQMKKTQDWLNLPLPEELIAVLQPRLQGEEERLFPELTSDRQRRNARKRVQALFTKQEVREKNITLHTFRHTYAHKLLDSGVPKEVIQTFLGHQSVTTTEIYANWVKSKRLKPFIQGLQFDVELTTLDAE